VGFCLVGLLLKYREDKKVSIPFSMQKIHEQISNPEKIIKWYLPFAGVDTTRQALIYTSKKIASGNNYLDIQNQSMAGTGIITGDDATKKVFVFTIIPDSINKMKCDVQLSYNTTLFKKLFGGGSLEKNAVKSLENLKAYMEDTKKLYGFHIEREMVLDTSFLFGRRTVPVIERQAATKKLFENLISYAEKNKLGYTGTRIFYSMKNNMAEITLYASIGITNSFENKQGSPFEYKAMPVGKNLLVATYQGPFGDVYKVYAALDEYRTDYFLTSMAIPYQKFMNEGYDFADDQVVQMKVYYPIF
jgi:effector-binding domain-containing protein